MQKLLCMEKHKCKFFLSNATEDKLNAEFENDKLLNHSAFQLQSKSSLWCCPTKSSLIKRRKKNTKRTRSLTLY